MLVAGALAVAVGQYAIADALDGLWTDLFEFGVGVVFTVAGIAGAWAGWKELAPVAPVQSKRVLVGVCAVLALVSGVQVVLNPADEGYAYSAEDGVLARELPDGGYGIVLHEHLRSAHWFESGTRVKIVGGEREGEELRIPSRYWFPWTREER